MSFSRELARHRQRRLSTFIGTINKKVPGLDAQDGRKKFPILVFQLGVAAFDPAHLDVANPQDLANLLLAEVLALANLAQPIGPRSIYVS